MPQKSWSKKDEKMYEHIKDSERDRGRPASRAGEVAARTVNKHRRIEGRTKSKRTSGTGNPNKPLGERTRDELYNLAQEHGLKGRSRMSKSELVSALGG
ncbi:MAG: Rho termination factor N-terminal domain-containing protein [Armatimonadetes bacterium]|nr:Rho termination factor N-terminal domain-containing protein [Armatimonadota bacterium]